MNADGLWNPADYVVDRFQNRGMTAAGNLWQKNYNKIPQEAQDYIREEINKRLQSGYPLNKWFLRMLENHVKVNFDGVPYNWDISGLDFDALMSKNINKQYANRDKYKDYDAMIQAKLDAQSRKPAAQAEARPQNTVPQEAQQTQQTKAQVPTSKEQQQKNYEAQINAMSKGNAPAAGTVYRSTSATGKNKLDFLAKTLLDNYKEQAQNNEDKDYAAQVNAMSKGNAPAAGTVYVSKTTTPYGNGQPTGDPDIDSMISNNEQNVAGLQERANANKQAKYAKKQAKQQEQALKDAAYGNGQPTGDPDIDSMISNNEQNVAMAQQAENMRLEQAVTAAQKAAEKQAKVEQDAKNASSKSAEESARVYRGQAPQNGIYRTTISGDTPKVNTPHTRQDIYQMSLSDAEQAYFSRLEATKQIQYYNMKQQYIKAKESGDLQNAAVLEDNLYKFLENNAR